MAALLGFALVREKGIFGILNSSLALAYHLLEVDLFGLPHGGPSIIPSNKPMRPFAQRRE